MPVHKKTIQDRQRGSIVDAVTLTEFVFQFEPSQHKDKSNTVFGEHSVIGHRLTGFHWVGGGKSEVELEIYLLGAAFTNFANPTPSEVGEFRMAQLGDWQPKILIDTGETNEDGTAVMRWIDNPQPAPKTDDLSTARERIRQGKANANKSVMRQLGDLKKLLDPKDDIGAPHPVLINMGGLYTGKQFLLVEVDASYISRNLETQEPYEAQVRLKLHQLGENAKYSGAGARR